VPILADPDDAKRLAANVVAFVNPPIHVVDRAHGLSDNAIFFDSDRINQSVFGDTFLVVPDWFSTMTPLSAIVDVDLVVTPPVELTPACSDNPRATRHRQNQGSFNSVRGEF